MRRITTLITSTAMLCLASLASADDDCADHPGLEHWPAEIPLPVDAIPREHWFVHDPDWIVAPTACVALAVARELDEARASFETHFQSPTTRGAVLSLQYVTRMADLRAAGADWVLPWKFSEPSTEADPFRSALEDQVRSQIEAQLSRSGRSPDPARVEALVAQSLAQLDTRESTESEAGPETGDGNRLDAIRHEVAHLLFIRELWPSSGQGSEQYGGDAPDWLDETAAVLAESETMTRDRRQALTEAVAEGRLRPLAEYLRMSHPSFGGGAFAAMIEEARASAEGPGVIFIASEDGDESIDDAALFYTQTRAWIDYLDERTGDGRVFARITEALKAGKTFAAWLFDNGASLGLPSDFADLEIDFLAWASGRFESGA
jgi:hypothetical protein